MMATKSPHKNLFPLSLAFICLPPKYLPVDKVKVTNEILLQNILLHCISNNAAVEALAELLMSPDLDKDCVKSAIKVLWVVWGKYFFNEQF